MKQLDAQLNDKNIVIIIIASSYIPYYKLEASKEEWVNSKNNTEVGIVNYVITQAPRWFLELTHSSLEASN